MARKRSPLSTTIQSFLVGGALLLAGFTSEAESRLQAAQDAYGRGDFGVAIEHLEVLVDETEQPHERASVLLNLAAMYLEVGNWDGAEDAIAQANQILESNANLKLSAALQEVQGKLHFIRGQYPEAFRAWEAAGKGFEQLGMFGDMYRTQLNQARARHAQGQSQAAIAQLKTLYQVVQAESFANSMFKAQVYKELAVVGLVVGNLTISPDIRIAVADEERLEYLGQALTLLQEANVIAENISDRELQAVITLELGNLERATYYRVKDSNERVKSKKTDLSRQWEHASAAIDYYQNARDLSSKPFPQSTLNQMGLSIDIFESSEEKKNEYSLGFDELNLLFDKVPSLVIELQYQPSSHTRLLSQISLVHQLLTHQEISVKQGQSVNHEPIIMQLLTNTLHNVGIVTSGELSCQVDISKTTNPLIAAFSLSSLGGFYEQQEQWSQAKTCTEAALSLAQPLQHKSLLYQVQWQLGRLLAQDYFMEQSQSLKKHQQAVAVYENTLDSLDAIRSDLVSLNQSEFRFSFRDEVEPVYREFITLLLAIDTIDTTKQGQKTSKLVAEIKRNSYERVTTVMEELQLAAIEDYLRCDLQNNKIQTPSKVIKTDTSSKAVLIYPIFNKDRLEIILKYKQDDKINVVRRSSQAMVEDELNGHVAQILKDTRGGIIAKSSKPNSSFRKTYRLLIEPIEKDLEEIKPSTLVFGLDRFFDSIPLAALYDGNKYLIESYAIAINLGLPLYENSKLPKPQNLDILLAGGTKFGSKHSELEKVGQEIESIEKQFKNRTETLFEGNFTSQNLQNKVTSKPFSIVHLATHGKFSSTPEKTVIITPGPDPDINLNQIEAILQQRGANFEDAIQLLVLSACQTAVGDKRASLGLAGITVQAGARSTVASLQKVNDASTANFMEEFYKQLSQPSISRAEVLRKAQIAMLGKEDNANDRKPKAWATFILVGSWQ